MNASDTTHVMTVAEFLLHVDTVERQSFFAKITGGVSSADAGFALAVECARLRADFREALVERDLERRSRRGAEPCRKSTTPRGGHAWTGNKEYGAVCTGCGGIKPRRKKR